MVDLELVQVLLGLGRCGADLCFVDLAVGGGDGGLGHGAAGAENVFESVHGGGVLGGWVGGWVACRAPRGQSQLGWVGAGGRRTEGPGIYMREKAAVVPTRGDVSPAGGSEVGEVTEEPLRQGVGRRNDGFSWLEHTAGDKGVLRAAENSLRAGPMSGGAQITGQIAAATGAGAGAADTPCRTMPQPWPVGRQILASGGPSGCVACSAAAAVVLALACQRSFCSPGATLSRGQTPSSLPAALCCMRGYL